MNQVRIGTIVPGDRVHDLLPEFIKSGFECFALNFHMEFPDESLAAFAERVKAAVDGEMPEISSIGYYCNPLENEEQLHILEKFIDGAHLFNTNMVPPLQVHFTVVRWKKLFRFIKKFSVSWLNAPRRMAYVFLLRTAQWAEHGAEQHTTSALIRVHGK